MYLSSIKTELAINFQKKKNFCTWLKTGLALKGLSVLTWVQAWINCNLIEMELIINFWVIVIEVLNEKIIVIIIDCCSVHIFS